MTMTPDRIAEAPIWYIVFLLSITCHEAAHALAAKLGGDPTAFHEGQITLDPWPHMRREPFGTIVVPLLSLIYSGTAFGWASAPYDPLWEERHPRKAALMALAGPLANLALAVSAGVMLRIGLATGFFHTPAYAGFSSLVVASQKGFMSGIAVVLSILFSLNLLLAIFNLIPLPPLDGISVIRLVVPAAWTDKLLTVQRRPVFAMIGILLAWQLGDLLFRPVFALGLRLLF